MRARSIFFALLMLPVSGALQAQTVEDEAGRRQFSDAEIAAVPMPELAFEPSTSDVESYGKYFYFRRPDTSFDESYANIIECDALSSGVGATAYGATYSLGGMLGGALGDALHGSAQRRATHRISMRNCMSFKGYARYGLDKDLWTVFNFEEGNGRKPEEERQAALMQQARVGSGPAPQAEAIEP